MVVASKIHSGVSPACKGECGVWIIATRENGCNQSP